MQKHQSTTVPDYHKDFFAWTQHQARLLRALAERPRDLPDNLDVANVAEEIEGLGSAELNTVKSLIRQILVHLIKSASERNARATAHWRSEAVAFAVDLRDHYLASMRQNIDMDSIWRGARKVADARLKEEGLEISPELPKDCPFEVRDIVSDDFSFDDALDRLR